MKTKQVMVLGLPLIACCLFWANRRGYAEPVQDPDQLNAYKAALREEIATSIRTEPGVKSLTLLETNPILLGSKFK
jgi:hypothetical protein